MRSIGASLKSKLSDAISTSKSFNLQRVPVVPITVFLATFLLSFVAGSLIIQPQASKAVTGLGLVAAQTMTLTSSTGALALTVTPTNGGALVSGSHNLTASTNVPTGYSLALTTTATTLPTTTGTYASPAPLANNAWGYALAGVSGFDASYTTPTPSAASKWANPSQGATIKNTTASSANDGTTVYYAVKANNQLTAGSYSNTVRYTATANTTNLPAPNIMGILPRSGTTAGGTVLEIRGVGFTVNDESVTTAVMIGGAACGDVTISSNTPSTGQDTIYCETPAHAAGAVDVVVSTWGGTTVETGGYDYMTPANVSFVSPSLASTIAGTESGPAFTIVGTNFTGATSASIGGTNCSSIQVVSDTQIFCEAPNTITGAGNKNIVVTKTFGGGNTVSTGAVSVSYSDVDYPTLQGVDAFANCSTTAKLFRDTRDSQLYYVKKMADTKCWMVDNLKYANYGELSQEAGKYLTVDGTSAQSTANSDVAKYVDPGASTYCKGNTDMPANTNTKCGLLYNWYAATGGAGTYAESTKGTNVSGSICPTNFRLPSSLSDGIPATSNGTSNGAADFPVLNASMNAGALTTGSVSNYYTGWQPSGSWGGMFSGSWDNNLVNTGGGGFGYYWSSTVDSATTALYLAFRSSDVGPSSNNPGKSDGDAVRCVMDAPAGTNPSNISSTNPAVIDVYPTTGWEGDTVAITSNALFANATAVTIGGTNFTDCNVVTPSLITCILPAKTAGTSNDIAVTVGGVNVTDTSTYTHMKVTYFDPSATTVTVGGTTYDYYANGFTRANCSAMTSSNAAIGTEPANSIAYVRDARNGQVYRVKKMADDWCWMVDSLKYIDTTIVNSADSTVGMIYNNGDHLSNGGSNAYNTVDESGVQSDTNSDKAFYNNPMGGSACYGSTYLPSGSLTHCGYRYNWYAATNGAGTYAQNTQGTNVTGGGICPVNFRLLSGMSDGSTATGNGTSYNRADLSVLNASMNAGFASTGSTTSSYYAGWQSTGSWGGMLGGAYSNRFVNQGQYGDFWSSTVGSDANAQSLGFTVSNVSPGDGSDSKYYGFAVRCILR